MFTGEKNQNFLGLQDAQKRQLAINVESFAANTNDPAVIGSSSPINPLLDMSQASGFPQIVESKINNARNTSIEHEQSLKGSIFGDAQLKFNEGKTISGFPGLGLAQQSNTADANGAIASGSFNQSQDPSK